MAYAIFKHTFENLIKYEMVNLKSKFLGFLWNNQAMIPVYSKNCVVCGKTRKTHDLQPESELLDSQ